MWRFLAAGASALMLRGAGLVRWTSGKLSSLLLSAIAPPLARSTDAPAASRRGRGQREDARAKAL